MCSVGRVNVKFQFRWLFPLFALCSICFISTFCFWTISFSLYVITKLLYLLCVNVCICLGNNDSLIQFSTIDYISGLNWGHQYFNVTRSESTRLCIGSLSHDLHLASTLTIADFILWYIRRLQLTTKFKNCKKFSDQSYLMLQGHQALNLCLYLVKLCKIELKRVNNILMCLIM